jgi:hypothetical protein
MAYQSELPTSSFTAREKRQTHRTGAARGPPGMTTQKPLMLCLATRTGGSTVPLRFKVRARAAAGRARNPGSAWGRLA